MRCAGKSLIRVGGLSQSGIDGSMWCTSNYGLTWVDCSTFTDLDAARVAASGASEWPDPERLAGCYAECARVEAEYQLQSTFDGARTTKLRARVEALEREIEVMRAVLATSEFALASR